jgi:hypothetical protein
VQLGRHRPGGHLEVGAHDVVVEGLEVGQFLVEREVRGGGRDGEEVRGPGGAEGGAQQGGADRIGGQPVAEGGGVGVAPGPVPRGTGGDSSIRSPARVSVSCEVPKRARAMTSASTTNSPTFRA